MDEIRKNAYRYLLYQATLDIQYLPSSLNPIKWIKRRRIIRSFGPLANWLHVMACYSCYDFVGFDETIFWKEHTKLSKRFPRTTVELYPAHFQGFLDNFYKPEKDRVVYLRPPNWPNI